MTDPTPTRDEAVPTGWRYSINYGPDGEQNFANVYAADGQFVGNLRTHHAIAICNAFAVCEKLTSAPAPASGRVDAVAAIAKIIDPECFKLLAEGNNLTTGQAANYRDAYGKAHLILASLSPAATPVSEAEPVAAVVAEELALKIVSLSVNWLREDGTDREHDDYVRANWTKEIAEAKRLILAALAKPAAGGDVTREALKPFADIADSFDQADPTLGWVICSVYLSDLRRARSIVRDAALSQSTSAGRVGE